MTRYFIQSKRRLVSLARTNIEISATLAAMALNVRAAVVHPVAQRCLSRVAASAEHRHV